MVSYRRRKRLSVRGGTLLGKIVVFAEKPDFGTSIAAVLGGCFIDGVELTPKLLTNKRYEGLIKKKRSQDGYLKAKLDGKDCIITWGFGHIAVLKQAMDYDPRFKYWSEDLFPFIPERYEIKLKEEPGIKKQFQLIKKLFNDTDTEYIINATDADREGELIFDYIYRLTGCKKPYKRLWISSQTEEAIEKGFRELKSSAEMKTLQEAGRARAIADWVVGANLTAMATLKFGGYKNIISIGRVQTPTLAILVNRENEIKNFRSENYYELIGEFETEDGKRYKGKWKKGDIERFSNLDQAKEILHKVKGKNALITNYSESRMEENPPLLYDLTTLQMEANSRYGFSAKKTLDIAQQLYEKQVLSYPRTDSRYLSDDLKHEIPRLINALDSKYDYFKKQLLGKKLIYSKRVFDNSKVGSHHAIIPTYKTPKGLTDDQKLIYFMVAERLLMAFMPKAIWSNTRIETTVEGEIFYSSGRTLIEKGWRALADSEKTDEVLLPLVSKGDTVAGEYNLLTKKTKAPPRYTEKTLLSAMETAGRQIEDEVLREIMKKKGIGTPATRAEIIERLVQVGYVVKSKKLLIPTKKGMGVIKHLPIEEVKSPSLTGEWEYRLKLIEEGKEDADSFIKDIEKLTIAAVDTLKKHQKQEITTTVESFGQCPNCGSDVVKNKKGYGCSNWRSGCKFQIWDNIICGKRITKANIRQLLKKGETNLIKGFKSEKTGKQFNAKLELVKDGNGKLKFKFD